MRTAKALAIDGGAVSTRRGRWMGRTFAENFWAKVDRSGECWLWKGSLNHGGYGSHGIPGHKTELAHRVASVLAHGPLPAGVLVLHRPNCMSKACVRPEHTYRGDQRQNMRDAGAAGVLHGRNAARGDRQWLRKHPGRVVRDEYGRIANPNRPAAPFVPPRGEKNPQAKLSVDAVVAIRARLAQGEMGRAIARAFGVTESVVSEIKTGRAWGWLK